MHHTSTLHSSVQPKLAFASKANFLFSAIAILASFLRTLAANGRDKNNTDANNLAYKINDDDAFPESFLVSAPLCHAERVYPEHSRREARPELVNHEHSRREGSQHGKLYPEHSRRESPQRLLKQ